MLAIIPARGGSQGVLRKNVRVLGGEPLVVRKARQADRLSFVDRVVVSTDDEYIASVCRVAGIPVLMRRPELALPNVTLDKVAAAVCAELSYDGPVVVMQPTCPTVRDATLERMFHEFQADDNDTMAAAVVDHGNLWTKDGLVRPRVNRQYQNEPVWRETGAAFMVRNMNTLLAHGFVGPVHGLCELPLEEGVDVDTHDDLELARSILTRGRVQLIAVAGTRVGTGHLRRCITLADELSRHDVGLSLIACDDVDDPGFVAAQAEAEAWGFGEYVVQHADVLILDVLNAPVEVVADARSVGTRVICLEDLGHGSDLANVVVNELYEDARPHALIGPAYAVLRPEFIASRHSTWQDAKHDVLVTFGGTDPTGTGRLVREALELMGVNTTAPDEWPSLAEAVCASKLTVTSAGRTVHEVIALGRPVVSVPVNARERTHVHVPGVTYLKRGSRETGAVQIAALVAEMARDEEWCVMAVSDTRGAVDGLGGRRIAQVVENLLGTG